MLASSLEGPSIPSKNEYAASLSCRNRRYGNDRRWRRSADSDENFTDNFRKRTPRMRLRLHGTPHWLTGWLHAARNWRHSLTTQPTQLTLSGATARKYARTLPPSGSPRLAVHARWGAHFGGSLAVRTCLDATGRHATQRTQRLQTHYWTGDWRWTRL